MSPSLHEVERRSRAANSHNSWLSFRGALNSFDPHHEREEEIFTRLGYIDVKNLAPRIKAKVFMGLSLMDQICPPSTQFAVYNAIRSAKECLIYPDFAHETLSGFDDRAFVFLGTL